MANVLTYQLESRNVKWPWAGRREVVTLPRWYWSVFDALAMAHKISHPGLHREIWASSPGAPTLTSAVARYVEHYAAASGHRLYAVANDDPRWANAAMANAGHTRPSECHPLPKIVWSPFRPIARPQRLFA